MEVKSNAKKIRAAVVAGALAGAIALTGTLAWRNMTQETANEFVVEKNPGGRMHDDFNGVENKDIYAENFTDTEKGVPVFVRVKLLEYMEVGEDAGLKRTVPDPITGGEKTNPDRKATPLVAGSDINDPSTWRLHKPETGGETDPFHQYWIWDQSGDAVYMPTFNKNKDSVTVDSNGTYVGSDGIFETGKPYDDYVDCIMGDILTADAYYDADSNDVDEFDPVNDPKKDPPVPPGGGGTEKTTENPKGNYTKKEETHASKLTLNSLGVMTMDEWIKAGKPVCNRWIWDSDGWFYWPEPIQPETATGLLLNKVSRSKRVTEDNYYAVNVVSQFVDADKTTWGAPASGEGVGATPATGLYKDGITDNAMALLDQAISVQVVTNIEEGERWYLPLGQNVYREILDDEGELGELICAEVDEFIGTEDDRTDVVYVEEGVTVNGKFYGHYLLKPTEDEPYYRAVGEDELLGTEDDDRLWLLEGWPFPSGLVDKVVDTVELTAEDGRTELEVDTSLQLTAAVKLGDTFANSQRVKWSVEAADGSELCFGTTISPEGLLTIDAMETETTKQLVVTAASWLDDRVVKTYNVTVYGKARIEIIPAGGAESVQAGKSLQFSAKAYRGKVEVTTPITYTWEVENTARANIDEFSIDQNGLLKVGRSKSGYAKVTAWYHDGVRYVEGEKSIPILDPAQISLILTEPTGEKKLQVGQSLEYSARLEGPTEELGTTEILWYAGTSADGGRTLNNTNVAGVSIKNGVLTLNSSYRIDKSGDTLYVRADAKDPTVNGIDSVMSGAIKVIGPSYINVGREGGGNLEVVIGRQIQLTASVMDTNRQPYTCQDVTWKIMYDNLKPGTGIGTTSGLLTAGQTEASYNTSRMLKIRAISKVDENVYKEFEVRVWDGSFRLGGIDFYELYRDEANGRRLIITKYIISDVVSAKKYAFSHVQWSRSNCKTDLENWVNRNRTLRDAIWKDNAGDYAPIYTRSSYTSSYQWHEVKCPAFLLSEADLYGTANGGCNPTQIVESRDFTAGVKLEKPPIGTWAATFDTGGSVDHWWLRSPRLNATSLAMYLAGQGDTIIGSWDWNVAYAGLRPAMWVRI